MCFVTPNLAARTHSYMMDTLCALTIVFPSVACVCSFCMSITPATPWTTRMAPCLQLRPTTSPSTTTVSMVMRITIRGQIFPKGGGGDAEHPTFIPMYTLTTLQTPSGHTTRPRTYAIGHKVNSLLSEPSLPTCETWLLPQIYVLCMTRNKEEDHGQDGEDTKYKDQEKKLPESIAVGRPTRTGRPTTPRLRTTDQGRTSDDHQPPDDRQRLEIRQIHT